MSRVMIKHDCEHIEHINITVTGNKRLARIEQLKHQHCPTCYRTALCHAAADETTASELTPLEGTERVILLALLIRAQQLAAVDAGFAVLRRLAGTAGMLAEYEESMPPWRRRVAALRNQSSAAWWLQHGDDSVARLLRESAIDA